MSLLPVAQPALGTVPAATLPPREIPSKASAHPWGVPGPGSGKNQQDLGSALPSSQQCSCELGGFLRPIFARPQEGGLKTPALQRRRRGQTGGSNKELGGERTRKVDNFVNSIKKLGVLKGFPPRPSGLGVSVRVKAEREREQAGLGGCRCSLWLLESCIVIDHHSLPAGGDAAAAATAEVVGVELTEERATWVGLETFFTSWCWLTMEGCLLRAPCKEEAPVWNV